MVEPRTCLDELTCDCLAFVAQHLSQQQDLLVVSKQPVLVLVLVFAFVLLLAFVGQCLT